MDAWVVDSNLYIEAINSVEGENALATFESRAAPFLFLHSTVAQEILAGARDEATWRRYHEAVVEPFEDLARVLTPTHETWKRAALIITRLVETRRMSPGGFSRGFLNDCLIAASSAESGFVIVTRNLRDFTSIRDVEPDVRFAAPWP